MIETPRAALRADEIAEEADFFSFGTNDLTQMAFGFSRDDVESRMMPAYLEAGLLKRNPFETIDVGGVGELVKLGAQRGRQTKPDLKLGVCGEHGGDPESIDLFRAGRARLRELLAVPGARSPGWPRRRQCSRTRSPARCSAPMIATLASEAGSRESFASFDVHPWQWGAFIGLIVVLLLADLLAPAPQAASRSRSRKRRSRRRCGSRSGLPSVVLVLSWHGGQAAGEYWAGYLHRAEPVGRQRVRVGGDPHVLRRARAVPVPGAVLGHLRGPRAAGGVHLRRRGAHRAVRLGALRLRRRSCWSPRGRIARHDETETVDFEKSRSMRAVRRLVPSTTEYDGQRCSPGRTPSGSRRRCSPCSCWSRPPTSSSLSTRCPRSSPWRGSSSSCSRRTPSPSSGCGRSTSCSPGWRDGSATSTSASASILAYVGVKMLLTGEPVEWHPPTWLSLVVIAVVLTVAVVASLHVDRREGDADDSMAHELDGARRRPGADDPLP